MFLIVIQSQSLIQTLYPIIIPVTLLLYLQLAAAEKRPNQTVRDLLNEQRGVISSKTTPNPNNNQTVSAVTTTSNGGGGTQGSMVVDLTEDDDLNSPVKSKTVAPVSNPLLPPGVVTQGLRPIIPSAALPQGIRPGTYLLQQNKGGGTVLQQILSPTQVQNQQVRGTGGLL